MMQVRKIDTGNTRDVQQFVEFPFELYRDCPQWVPPLVSSIQNALNRRKHPFYHHSTADFFVAESDGQTLGRIAVMNNRNYNACRDSQVAFFGYLELVEDAEVARVLFEAAFDWARAQGLTQIVGPKGILGSDTGGVLVEGFEHRPAMGVPYNLPYYDALIEGVGFEKDTDYLSAYLPADHEFSERFYRVVERAKARSGFWIKTFRSKREMRQWVPRVVDAHRLAFEQAYTYYPPTDAEIALVFETLLNVVHPRLARLVMKGDQIIGFILAYHDVSEGVKRARGRLWPLGWVHILRDRQRTRWVNINGLGILPAYRGLGSNAILYTELARAIREFNFEHADLVQVEEGNSKSLAEMKVLEVTWYKRHRGYKRAL